MNKAVGVSKIERPAQQNPNDYHACQRPAEHYKNSVYLDKQEIEFLLYYLEQSEGSVIELYYGDGGIEDHKGVKVNHGDEQIIPCPYEYIKF